MQKYEKKSNRVIQELKKDRTYLVAVAVSNDMLTDRRVARHVLTMLEAGYQVSIVCRAPQVPASHQLPAACYPLHTKSARGWRFYAELNMKLWRELVRLKPDAVWVNDTDTLLGGWLAARQLRCRLVMDAHELFPEVPEIVHKPLVKWVWRTIESMLMPRCDALLTVCDSIAEYYRLKYGISMTVVRNVANIEKPESKIEKSKLSILNSQFPILLYQGSVNVGRGVDWAIDAMELLPECHLVIAGGGDLLEQMKHYASLKPWHNRITFTGRLMPAELEPLTAQADVGLVMLEDLCLSYHYALPNRIGDFIAAGVPMVVSNLPEMAAVVRRYRVGEVIADGAPAEKLAEAVKRVLAKQWTEEAFAAARKDMDWNKEKEKLLNICYTTFC